MAAKKYIVLHPIRHDGKAHARGASIPADKFEQDELTRLIGRGVIAEAGAETIVIKEVPVLLTESVLGKLNLEELTGYATQRGVTLREGLSKAEIISELSQAAQTGAAAANAEALAAAQGR